ncbi:MAG TPA: hypothetical protein VGM78_01890 [Ilumatobacteraceae bacterium]
MNTFELLLVLFVGVGLAVLYSRRVLQSDPPPRTDDVRRIAKRQKEMATFSRSLHEGRRPY